MPYELHSRPFSQTDFSPPPALHDPLFQYQPNVVCSACRELLGLAQSLYTERGQKLFASITTNYTRSNIQVSGDLGCHLCAIFAIPTEPQIPDDILATQDLGIEFAVHNIISKTQTMLLQVVIHFVSPPNSDHPCNSRGNAVYVFHEHNHSHIIPVDSYLLEKGELSLRRSTGDEETFTLAKTWLDQCMREHRLCANNSDEARITRPTRLLSLGEPIKLVDESESRGEEYVTLSHCWGDPKGIPQLRHGTEGLFGHEISFTILPKTFQDAVAITRRMGYKYLWIDSLCIIQDSDEDWKTHAKKMALFYANSAFTIAALKSTGSTGGCFTSTRNPLALRPIHLKEQGISIVTEAPWMFWKAEVDNLGAEASPLHSRAWVVQERLSSPRTLFYGQDGIYWECRCAQASELLYQKVAWDDPSNQKTWLQRLELATNNVRKNLAELQPEIERRFPLIPWMEHWSNLLRVYTTCNLTMQADKIIAVTGLISEIERLSSDHRRCILGLWDHDLSETAVWYRSRMGSDVKDPVTGRLANGMPTWTWASVDGQCRYPASRDAVVWKAPISIDDEASPPTMKIATLKRQVWITDDEELSLVPIEDQGDAADWVDEVFGFGMMDSAEGEKHLWYPDCGMPDQENPVYIAQIQRSRIVENPPLWGSRCLVITPVIADDAEKTHFIRLGTVFIKFGEPKEDPFHGHDASEIVVLQ